MIENLPYGNKLTGIFRGRVIKHLSNGYCKIWIPSIYPVEWKDKPDLLPSAELASSLFAGVCNGNGVFTYPNIGSTVWCMFENGDLNLPIYFASTLGNDNGNWNKAYAMPGAHPDDAYVHKIHVGKSDIEIYETGQIKLHVENGANACTLLMDADGNINLESTATLRLKSKAIIIDGETLIDIKSPLISTSANTCNTITAPAINLDSSSGHTKIISTSGTTIF